MGSKRRNKRVGPLGDFMEEENEIVFGIYCPPHPQPLLCPEANEGYGNLRTAFEKCAKKIEESEADLIMV